MKSLALVYRPKTFDDVVEQSSTKAILQQQLKTETFKHAYLFCGGAGTGKTTCARIFANELNNGQGNPVELDAASNNSVEDVRNIIQQAKQKSLESEYKVFIVDECHALSNSAWQAMLKLIEEPPAKSIFVFCTTDPQKIPKTIISRVQRYEFQRISQKGIVDRLEAIIAAEGTDNAIEYDMEAIEYIAKIAEGGMRDAITLMDKALSFNKQLTIENVVEALGTVDYNYMIKLTDAIMCRKSKTAINLIDEIYNNGKDLKQFVKQYIQFLLDVNKYHSGCEWNLLSIPKLKEYEKWMSNMEQDEADYCLDLLSTFVNLNADIKFSQSVKVDVECAVIMETMR